MYLTIEAEQNDSLHRMATKADHLVTLTHIPVKFTLRGLTVTAQLCDSTRDVIAKWEAQDRPLTPVQ